MFGMQSCIQSSDNAAYIRYHNALQAADLYSTIEAEGKLSAGEVYHEKRELSDRRDRRRGQQH